MNARKRPSPLIRPICSMESENFVANTGSRGVIKELKKSPVKWTSVSARIILTFISVVFLVVIFPSSIHGIFAAGHVHSFGVEFIFLPNVSYCSKNFLFFSNKGVYAAVHELTRERGNLS